MSKDSEIKVHVADNEPSKFVTIFKFLGNFAIALSIAALPLIYTHYSKDRGVDSIIAKEAFEILKLDLPPEKENVEPVGSNSDQNSSNKTSNEDDEQGTVTKLRNDLKDDSWLSIRLSVDFQSECYDETKKELDNKFSNDRERLKLYKAWAIDTINTYQNGSNLDCGLKDYQLPARLIGSEVDFVAAMSKYEKAIYYERLGYEALFDKNLKDAIKNFQTSENVYNSFHHSHEIAKYLRGYLTQQDVNWVSIYKYMIDKFIWKMPADIEAKLRKKTTE